MNKRPSQAFHQIWSSYVKPRVSFPIDPAVIGQSPCVSLNGSGRLYTSHSFSPSLFPTVLQENQCGTSVNRVMGLRIHAHCWLFIASVWVLSYS